MINYLCRALLLALFFLLISSFRDVSFQRESQPSQNMFLSVLTKSTMNAVSVDAIQLPLFEKSWVSSTDKSNFTSFNADLKVIADSKKIGLKILSIQKTQPLIRTTIHCGFYPHLFPIDDEELPVLS